MVFNDAEVGWWASDAGYPQYCEEVRQGKVFQGIKKWDLY